MRDIFELLQPVTDEALDVAAHRENTELHFTQAIIQLKVILRLARALSQEFEDEMPSNIAQQARGSLNSALMLLDQMTEFNLQQPSAVDAHHNIQTAMQNELNLWISTVRPHIRGTVEVAELAADLDARINEAADLQSAVRRLTEQSQGLVTTAATLAADMAAGNLSTYYSTQAENHRKAANRFLAGAAAGVVALAVVAGVVLSSIPNSDKDDLTDYLRHLSPRVFVLGLGLYALGVVVRAYRANAHLRVVNEHKANALKTFRLFQESAAEPGTRDLITAELVKAVFAADETGFIDSAPDRTVSDGQAGLLALIASNARPRS